MKMIKIEDARLEKIRSLRIQGTVYFSCSDIRKEAGLGIYGPATRWCVPKTGMLVKVRSRYFVSLAGLRMVADRTPRRDIGSKARYLALALDAYVGGIDDGKGVVDEAMVEAVERDMVELVAPEQRLELAKRDIVSRNGQQVVSSRVLAERFGKRHGDVLRDIKVIEIMEDFSRRNFALAEYVDEQGKPRKEYLLTRDGASLLVMGWTGAEAMAWKVAYIEAFNAAEAALQDPRGMPVHADPTVHMVTKEVLQAVMSAIGAQLVQMQTAIGAQLVQMQTDVNERLRRLESRPATAAARPEVTQVSFGMIGHRTCQILGVTPKDLRKHVKLTHCAFGIDAVAYVGTSPMFAPGDANDIVSRAVREYRRKTDRRGN